MPSANDNKRRHSRVSARAVSAHLCVADTWAPAVIENISAGGLFVLTEEALPVGMPVAINLARQGWSKILRVTGRVVGATGARAAARKNVAPGMRVKFDPLPSEDGELLVTLLAELGAPGAQPLIIRVGTADNPVLETPPPLPEKRGGAPVRASDAATFRGQIESAGNNWAPQATLLDKTLLHDELRTNSSEARRKGRESGEAAGGDPAPVETFVRSPDADRLTIQVRGLLMELGELRQRLAERESEVSELQAQLQARDEQLARCEREKSAAEVAVQRLTFQLASMRR